MYFKRASDYQVSQIQKRQDFTAITASQLKEEDLLKNINLQQESKDIYNRLHPQFRQPIRLAHQNIGTFLTLHTNDMYTSVREIDFLCIKTSNRIQQNYKSCQQQQFNKIHEQIMIPIVNSTVLLYKVSNQCLLMGKQMIDCRNIAVEHLDFMYKIAVSKIQNMAAQLRAKVPAGVDAQSNPRRIIHNNRIED